METDDRDWIVYVDSENPSYPFPPSDDAGFFDCYDQLVVVMHRHFGRDCDEHRLADFLLKRSLTALPDVWPRSEVRADLKKIRKNLSEAASLIEGLPEGIVNRMGEKAIQSLGVKIEAEASWGARVDFDRTLEKLPERRALQTISDLASQIAHITALVSFAIEEAGKGEPIGNKQIEAWRIVDTCAEICNLRPESISVPRSMNNAGPFYRLLVDVFEAFELDADPVSAFRGWRRYVDRSASEKS